jgi:hypothetical protein
MVLAGLIVAVVLMVVLWPGEKEPEYQGRKLSEWLAIYQANNVLLPSGQNGDTEMKARQMGEATRAIRQIGTNGFSWMVKWGGYKLPHWRWRAFSIYAGRAGPAGPSSRMRRVILGKREEKKVLALMGFQIFGEEARPAIPELLRKVDRTYPPNLEFLDRCFRCMGEGGLRAVLRSGLSPEDWERKIAAEVLTNGASGR